MENGEEWLAIPRELDYGRPATTLPERRAHLWALVLLARYIPCHMAPGETGWHLLVPANRFDDAIAELRLFEEENRHWPPPLPAANQLVENTLATLAILVLLATFHNLTRIDMPILGHVPPDWIDLGSADAARIMEGQWWRLVTALTLHADWLHLISNLAIGGVLIVFLCRELGSGLAWCLLLGSGILGNLVNAWIQPSTHTSVGASTAVFGAVGILAAISLVRYRDHLRRRWALPVAAALALLALLGTEGKRTDLGAHLFGFIYGVFLGLITEYLVARYGRPGRILNAILALADAAVVVAAWWTALAWGAD